MKHAPTKVFTAIRWIALAATLSFGVAHADDYADVAQLVRNGKLAEAMTKADQFLVSKPRDPQMRFLKGVIQRDSGKTSEAIATFTRLTEDYPELPEPYNNLAVLYAGQSQYDKARTALEMAIRTNPSYTTAHENLGDVYAKLASQAYGKALQLDSSNAAVGPKLALIRELFNPAAAKGQRPTTAASLPATPAATGNVPSAPTVPKPAPSLPETPVAKAPPTLPATVSNSKPAAVAPAAAAPAPVASAAPAPAAAPVTPAPAKPAPAEPNSSANAHKDVETAVRNWARAWAARDVKGYLAAYGKDFATPSGTSRSAWEEERRQRITSKSKISVKLENLNISVNGTKATAKFRQDYKANELAVSSRKSLDLVKSGDRWLIVRESVN
ncbi:L,D-transpeptidase Cds6 family protein [Rhodoferax mekongensis]|uniref:L,D-transpeptidase Cds6 family protein n=1 Tax=Rhodoferax mekongensis TaxID=3068341 RepID=UPI0028BD688F|nr:tetratricopeptide repeat protein [Rhodoferax sp. TBRC 17199]MDT7515786.1 tetratricopeptide repeat protein [Rhodoferax sp. TBRC 17199]